MEAYEPEPTISEETRIEVPHIPQRANWDCGIACAQMVLRYYGKSLEHFKEDCAKLRFGTSVWTIDLAYLMHCYGLSFTYTTITLGVDKGYKNKAFYKDKFSADELRVNEMFEEAYTKFAIEKRSVSGEELWGHVCGGRPAIALVDWNHLTCTWSDHKYLPSFSCMGRCLGTYQGHYIVLCGYNKTERIVYYKNPAIKKSLCCCSEASLEKARKAYGTDEDLILLHSSLTSPHTATSNKPPPLGAPH